MWFLIAMGLYAIGGISQAVMGIGMGASKPLALTGAIFWPAVSIYTIVKVGWSLRQ